MILDLGLPDLDGYEALRMLRAISKVPVVVATARDDEADIVRVLDAGADDYLVKPFGVGQIEARVRAVLRRATADESRPQRASSGRRAAARRRGARGDCSTAGRSTCPDASSTCSATWPCGPAR